MSVAGHDKAFTVSPPEELMCKMCDLVANTPKKSHCSCGGLYCATCISLLRAKCPKCQHPMNPVEDTVSANRINSLPVKCDNGEEGCEWIGDLSQLPAHLHSCLKHEIPCPYTTVGCEKTIMRGEVESHNEKTVHLHLHLAMLHLERLAGKTETAPIVFALKHFVEKKKTNVKWFSSPFYTHRGGYKMCLEVYPNGDSSGWKTHISLYIRLMQGYNDESLEWPFRGEVSLELLNQLQDAGHRTETIHFQNSEPSDTNSRVLHNDRSERGRGLQLFIPHSKLGVNADTNTCYLQQDTLYFRVTATKAYDSNTPWLTDTSASK